MQSVLVTGGAGYKGCVLVPKLLAAGWKVKVYDLMLFGRDVLPAHPDLEVIEADIRDTARFKQAVRGVDAVIHLACISNDPSFELDPELSRTINYDCFEPMVLASRAAGVKRFLYVSTSSVYGVSEAPEVTEDHPLVPLTDYNRYKGMCEPLLLAQQSPDFLTTIIRPATVCGYSPRMRFDLTVNIFTLQAITRGLLTIHGGAQKRPNIHIDDICELYTDLLTMPAEKIAGETFNAGYQNHPVGDIAQMVKRVVEQEMPERAPVDVQIQPVVDMRSYHVSSKKIADRLGFVPRRTLEDAVRDVCRAFKDGRFPNPGEERYYNVTTLKRLTPQLIGPGATRN